MHKFGIVISNVYIVIEIVIKDMLVIKHFSNRKLSLYSELGIIDERPNMLFYFNIEQFMSFGVHEVLNSNYPDIIRCINNQSIISTPILQKYKKYVNN